MIYKIFIFFIIRFFLIYTFNRKKNINNLKFNKLINNSIIQDNDINVSKKIYIYQII